MDRKDMTIVHIVTRMYLGGAQIVSLQILQAAKEKGYKVLMITGEDEELTGALRDAGIRIETVKQLDRSINPFKDIVSLIKIISLLKRVRRESSNLIVHTHTSKSGLIGRFAAYFSGLKEVYHTAHGWSFHEGQNLIVRKLFAFSESAAARHTKKIIAVSEYVKREGIGNGVGKDYDYVIIRNGVRRCRNYPDEEKAVIRREYGVYDERVVLQVSCLKPQKSPMDFLYTAEKFLGEPYKFIIAGDGEMRREMDEYIKKRKLTNTILAGWVHDIDRLYSIADCFLLTSVFEGYPLVLLEYMQYNKPVITSDIEPNREVSENFSFCKVHDIDQFVFKIKDSIENKNYYREPVWVSQMAEKYLDLYNDL